MRLYICRLGSQIADKASILFAKRTLGLMKRRQILGKSLGRRGA